MIQKIRELMVKGLHEYTGLIAIDTDNPNKKPKYPYFSFKFTTIRQNIGENGAYSYDVVESLDSKFKHDVLEKATFQPHVVISFNAYSKDLSECQEKTLKAWEWFKVVGRGVLSNNNIVIVNVGNIQDRSIHIVDHYEYRQGFDIEIRVLHEIESRSETIEKHKMEGEII